MIFIQRNLTQCIQQKSETASMKLFRFVGATGFEPATAWSQTRSATGLRYTPSRKTCCCFAVAKVLLFVEYCKYLFNFL